MVEGSKDAQVKIVKSEQGKDCKNEKCGKKDIVEAAWILPLECTHSL